MGHMRITAIAILLVQMLPALSAPDRTPDEHPARDVSETVSNRVQTIRMLATLSATNAVSFETNLSFIVRAARDRDRGVRQAAAVALSRTAPLSLEAIRTLLKDTDACVRECGTEAVRMMARFDRATPLRMVPDLVPLLDDPVWIVRREAALAIARVYVPDLSLRDRIDQIVDADSQSPCPTEPATPASSPPQP